MKQNSILRLCLFLNFLFSLYSCHTDDLIMQGNKSKDKATINSRIIHLQELKENHLLFSQITKLSRNKISTGNAVSKIYSDAENGFSVVLDDVLYTEDTAGNKTYTFKIQPRESNTGKLENFILQDLGNAQFEAYMATYDQTAVGHLDQLTVAELKNHVTMVPLGSISGPEVFGKYNANFCHITIPEFITMYIPGAMCCENLHNYAQIADCKCPPSGLPTDGYTAAGISYTTYDVCGGNASPGNGSNGGGGVITTSPHGGSGSPDLLNSPCEKIATLMTDNKFKEKIAAIDKPEVFDYDHEMGFASAYPVNTTATGTQYQPMENVLGSESVSLPDGDQYFGFTHTHNNKEGAIKIFSPADLATFLTSCSVNANTHGDITDAYAMVVTSENNYILQFSGNPADLLVGVNTYKFWKAWYIREMEKLILENDLTQYNIEKVFLRFLKEKVKINGIELYQVEKNTGKAKRLNLDNTNNVKPTPCP